MIYFQAVS